MVKTIFKKAVQYTLNVLRSLKLRVFKIIREVIDLFFLITALYLAVPGLHRLIGVMHESN